MDGFQSEEAFLQEACQPVLVYQQGSEVRRAFVGCKRAFDCIAVAFRRKHQYLWRKEQFEVASVLCF